MIEEVQRYLEDALAYNAEDYEEYKDASDGSGKGFLIDMEIEYATAVELHAFLKDKQFTYKSKSKPFLDAQLDAIREDLGG